MTKPSDLRKVVTFYAVRRSATAEDMERGSGDLYCDHKHIKLLAARKCRDTMERNKPFGAEWYVYKEAFIGGMYVGEIRLANEV